MAEPPHGDSNGEPAESSPTLLAAGQHYHQAGDLGQAEDHYRRALEADPNREDVARYYAYLLDTQGRKQEARQILEDVLNRQPDNPLAISQYANFLLRMGETQEADSLLAKALEDHPRDRSLLTSAARLLHRTDRYQEAMDRYRQALEVSPHDLHLLLELARVELESGQVEAAAWHVDRVRHHFGVMNHNVARPMSYMNRFLP